MQLSGSLFELRGEKKGMIPDGDNAIKYEGLYIKSVREVVTGG